MDQLHLVSQYLIRNEKIGGELFTKLMKGELNDEKAKAALEAANVEMGILPEVVETAADKAQETPVLPEDAEPAVSEENE